MKIVFITGRLNICYGVTSYLLNLLSHLSKKCEIILIGAEGNAVSKFITSKIKLILIEEVEFDKRNLLNFTIAVWKVLKLIYKHKPDVIHSNSYYNANIAKYASHFLKIKPLLVQTIHGDHHHTGRLKKYNADRYILVNKQLKEIITNYDERMGAKSFVIFDGIYYDETIKVKSNKKKSDLKIITVARLIKNKEIQNIIEALYHLYNRYGIKLGIYIYGEGDYKDDLESLAKKLKVDAYFLGSESDKNKIYGNADIFIFSSIMEGFGLTLLEAANYLNFIIASDFEGIENIFEDKIDGFLFKKYSVEDLAEKIKLAIDLDREDRIKIAGTFRKKAIDRFSAERMAQETMKVYEAK